MTLEDHAGDVVRKARMMGDIPAADSAAAAGLSPEALAEFESGGVPPEGMDFVGMGRRLDLDGAKLRTVANGWLPVPVKTEVWRQFRMITTAGNGMTVNAFLVWDESTKDAALFDTGFDDGPIVSEIERHGLRLRHIFITHGHGDHVEALEPLRTRYPEARPHANAKGVPAPSRNQPGEIVAVGGLRIAHRETPGHAEDGVTYVVTGFPGGAPAIAVVGDAIFAGSIGGAPGKGPLAKGKVREEILSLPGPTLICPGHGPLTTVAEQRAINPFFPGLG